jgi:hypothetical protein
LKGNKSAAAMHVHDEQSGWGWYQAGLASAIPLASDEEFGPLGASLSAISTGMAKP